MYGMGHLPKDLTDRRDERDEVEVKLASGLKL